MEKPVVRTKYGAYVGVEEDEVFSFKGVPYAKGPVGDLRWKPPQPLGMSEETFSAEDYGPAPVQPLYFEKEYVSRQPQSEDCLSLNIWTRHPERSEAEEWGCPKENSYKRPVIVFVHGGACLYGGSCDTLYDGQLFVKRNDVVMVTVNYRLNAYGCMDLEEIGGPEYAFSKNLCLLDQIQAFRWVKENISLFGGDPNNVTAVGESAGGACVSLLMIMQEAKGLFGKAIVQSGSYSLLKREQTKTFTKEAAMTFAKMAGADTMDELLALSREEIDKTFDIFLEEYAPFADGICMPVLDGKTLPKDPYKALEDGAAEGIRMLIGSNSEEFNFWKLITPEFDQAIDEFFIPLHNVAKEDWEADVPIYEIYIENDHAGNILTRKYQLANDLVFRDGSIAMAELQAKYGDTYMYSFEWQPVTGLGAYHGAELGFVFGTQDVVEELSGQMPEELIHSVQAAWASFASTGDPGHSGIPKWPKYNNKKRATMIIDQEWQVREDIRKEDRLLLRSLIKI